MSYYLNFYLLNNNRSANGNIIQGMKSTVSAPQRARQYQSSEDTRLTPWGGKDCSGGERPKHGKGGRPVRNAVRTSEELYKGDNTGEGPRHTTVGQTSKFYRNGFMGGTPLSVSDLDNYGDIAKGRG